MFSSKFTRVSSIQPLENVWPILELNPENSEVSKCVTLKEVFRHLMATVLASVLMSMHHFYNPLFSCSSSNLKW